MQPWAAASCLPSRSTTATASLQDDGRILWQPVDDAERQLMEHHHRARPRQPGEQGPVFAVACRREIWAARDQARTGQQLNSPLSTPQVAELANHLSVSNKENRSAAEKLVEQAQAASGDNGSKQARSDVVRSLLALVSEKGLYQGVEARGASTLLCCWCAVCLSRCCYSHPARAGSP